MCLENAECPHSARRRVSHRAGLAACEALGESVARQHRWQSGSDDREREHQSLVLKFPYEMAHLLMGLSAPQQPKRAERIESRLRDLCTGKFWQSSEPGFYR